MVGIRIFYFLIDDEAESTGEWFGLAVAQKTPSKMEFALAESELKFRNVVESSTAGMHFHRLEADDRLIFIGFNPATDQIVGISHAGLIGKTLEESFPNLVSAEITGMFLKVARGKIGPQPLEVPYKDERFSGVYDSHVFRSVYNLIVVDFVDVSEEIRATEKISEQTSLLESQV